jgi:hypothetical protein
MSEHARFIRRNKDKIARAHDGVFIGAVDFSFNEHHQQKYSPCWCPHLHGFIIADRRRRVAKALKRQFPRTTITPTPVKIVAWDRDIKAAYYMMKSVFKRRIAIDHGKRFDKKTGEYRTCRDTDNQPLRSRDLKELLLHLDSIGLAGRLVLRGVQFQNLKDLGPTFKTRPIKKRVRENRKEEDSGSREA